MKKSLAIPQITIEVRFSPVGGVVVKRPRQPGSWAVSMFYSPEFELKTESDKPADPVKSNATFVFPGTVDALASILKHIRAVAKEIGCKLTEIQFEVTEFKAELPEQKRKAGGYQAAIDEKNEAQLRGVTAVLRALIYDAMTFAEPPLAVY